MSDSSQPLGAGKAGPAKDRQGTRKAYRAPTLTEYGSVRDMTGAITPTGPGDGAAKMNSDAALKENVLRIGGHSAGFGLYLYDYKPQFRDAHGHGRQFGVMAQEVERYIPEAVSVGEDGYRRVDYARLGIVRH